MSSHLAKFYVLDQDDFILPIQVLEKNRYREEAEKVPPLNEQIGKLLRDLDTEQLNSKKLESALMEAQEQHEITTQHFEVFKLLNVFE